MTSAHSDHRLVQPTIWTCDDDADRSPSKSDGVVDLSVQHGHQLLAVLYHPLAPVFAGSRSHRLVFHQAAHSLSVKEASHERGSVAFPPSDCSVVNSLHYDSFIPSPRLAIDGHPETNDTFVISNEPHGQTPRHIARCTSLENYRGSPFVGTLQGYSSSPLRRDSEQENG